MNNYAPRRSFPVRFLGFIWRFITGLRTAVLNILFLLIVFIIVAAIFSQDKEPIPERAPLLVSLSGTLVDQYTYLSPQDRLLSPGSSDQAEMRLRDLIKVIHFAGNDNRISGLILDLNQFQGGGMSKIQELGTAIDRFKDTGKPVIAMSDNYDQQQYLLASYANDIYLHSMGRVAITGFGMYRSYYKRAFDKVALNFHVFKVGKFKDFVEPYIRDSMSEASRAHNSLWINELWQNYVDQIESRRDLAEGTLNQWINTMDDQLAKVEGDIALMAQEMHLVDYTLSRVERRQALIEQFGHRKDEPDSLNLVSYQRYQHEVLNNVNPFSDAQIALVVARGSILDGEQPEGTIGGDTLANTLRRVGRDDNIKALVLRIDSGGGSAFASEIIREQIQALRDKGIKVVVSMGSVTASGGYWIASEADEIWATPSTITGSIGVFGLFPTVNKTLDKIGITNDGFGTTNLAGALRIDRPLSDQAANILQQGVENIYDRFLSIVATRRASSVDEVHEIAQGRVWSAKQAQQLGLVDQLGYLDDAIGAAATMASLDSYDIKVFERELSPQEAFLKELMEETEMASTLSPWLSQTWSGVDLSLLRVFVDAAQQTPGAELNALNYTYATCLECLAP